MPTLSPAAHGCHKKTQVLISLFAELEAQAFHITASCLTEMGL